MAFLRLPVPGGSAVPDMRLCLGWQLARLLIMLVLTGGTLPGFAVAAGAHELSAREQADGRLAHVLARGRLIVGIKADYPPWGMLDAAGNIVGLEADLAQNLARRLGVGLELVAVSTANRQQRLAQGQVDMLIATLGDTTERRAISDLIQPHYYASGVRLLAHDDLPFSDWGELRGRPVCLTEGSYYNRMLSERYLITPVTFVGTRDTQLALRGGRCVGWAYDDTVLAQVVTEPGWEEYKTGLPTILQIEWAIAVRQGEGERSLGRFVSDTVVDWHRSGYLLERQQRWGLADHDYLRQQHALWIKTDADGQLVCQRQVDGDFPPDCLAGVLRANAVDVAALPPWIARLKDTTGLDLSALFDRYHRSRLLTGIGLTLAISVVSIIGSLVVGVLFAVIENRFHQARGMLRWCVHAPARVLVACARMTPPILQLYIVFFGLSGLLASHIGISLSSFVVASLVFSVYAGASNAAVLAPALARRERAAPGTPLPALIANAVEQTFESMVSIMVNIVKAAGMASVIALPEVISSVNAIISEGGDAGSLMTLLLLFYFSFVLLVMALLNVLKRWVSQ